MKMKNFNTPEELLLLSLLLYYLYNAISTLKSDQINYALTVFMRATSMLI